MGLDGSGPECECKGVVLELVAVDVRYSFRFLPNSSVVLCNLGGRCRVFSWKNLSLVLGRRTELLFQEVELTSICAEGAPDVLLNNRSRELKLLELVLF